MDAAFPPPLWGRVRERGKRLTPEFAAYPSLQLSPTRGERADRSSPRAIESPSVAEPIAPGMAFDQDLAYNVLSTCFDA